MTDTPMTIRASRTITLALAGAVMLGLTTATVPGAAHASTPPALSAIGPADQPAGPSGTLLTEARRQLAAARHTHYQHTTNVDEPTGRFDYDCSGFLDYALLRVAPAAYRALPVSKSRPLAKDFVTAIRRAPTAPGGAWQRLPTISELRPGDIVTWLTPEDSDSDNTGHIMVALDAPTRGTRAGEWLVHIADSTSSPHAGDQRIGSSPNGLGTGTIGLTTDDAGHPVAYYWRGGVSTKLKHTEIVFGRPSGQ